MELAEVSCDWRLNFCFGVPTLLVLRKSFRLEAIKSDTHDCNKHLSLSSLAFIKLIDKSLLNHQIKLFLDLTSG